MKEHPDYKYRPRRKPKTLSPKKDTKYDYNLDLSRSLLSAPPPALGPDSDFKFPRALFPSFHYPSFYKLSEDALPDLTLNKKFAADCLALQAIYGSTLYSQAAAAVAAWPNPCVPCGCPSKSPSPPPGEEIKRPIPLLVKPEERFSPTHVI